MAAAHVRALTQGPIVVELIPKSSLVSVTLGTGCDIHLVITRDELQELISKGQAALQEADIAEEALARR